MTTTETNDGKPDETGRNMDHTKTDAELDAEALLRATEEVVQSTDEAAEAELQGKSQSTADIADGDDLTALSPEQLLIELVSTRQQLDELNEMKDGFLRAKAEMENIRRRSQNEIVSARKFAIEGFALEVLTVKDSLDQAALVELGDAESEAVIKMKEGLQLTLKQLDVAFGKFAVQEVEAAPGVKFNPEQHQAISMVASDEIEADHIIAVMQKGFLLKDRLLRPAMVVVAS